MEYASQRIIPGGKYPFQKATPLLRDLIPCYITLYIPRYISRSANFVSAQKRSQFAFERLAGRTKFLLRSKTRVPQDQPLRRKWDNPGHRKAVAIAKALFYSLYGVLFRNRQLRKQYKSIKIKVRPCVNSHSPLRPQSTLNVQLESRRRENSWWINVRKQIRNMLT